MNEKKLKRGLKDLSYLFKSENEIKPFASQGEEPGRAPGRLIPESRQEPGRVLRIFCSAGAEAEAAWTRKIAGQAPGHSRFLHVRSGRQGLNQDEISIGELRRVCARVLEPAGAAETESVDVWLTSSDLDLDEESALAGLADKVIVIVSTGYEEIKAAWQFLKLTATSGSNADYFLLSDTLSPARASCLFEEFSALASRFIGIDMSWLGSLSSAVRDDSGAWLNPVFGVSAGYRRPHPPRLNLLRYAAARERTMLAAS